MKQIDYAFAFGTPHRLTAALPDHGVKTLLDADREGVTMKWTYDRMDQYEIGACVVPKVNWSVRFSVAADGSDLVAHSWRRLEGWLPILYQEFGDEEGQVSLAMAGTASATLVKITVRNSGERSRQYSIRCGRNEGGGFNPAWVDPRGTANVLQAGHNDRADRILVLGLGADRFIAGMKQFTMIWELAPGEERSGWVIRPHEAFMSELKQLEDADWDAEWNSAITAWRSRVEPAHKTLIPDPALFLAFKASLADLFVMREVFSDGYIASVCGTEIYRNTNPFEPSQVPIVLDQLGMEEEAEQGIRFFMEQQEQDGDWTGAKGWTFTMWGGTGFKSHTIMEHYRLTNNKAYLELAFPRMLASSRWQERMRNSTRYSAEELAERGLMPRGMGDCGLLNGDDHFGVFYPHNIWAVYADKLALEAAEILGKDEHIAELSQIYQEGRKALLESLSSGTIIAPDGSRWIPASSNNTSGSRWGALHALYPTGLLPEDHEWINGTIQYMENHLSLGGLPVDTGGLKGGMWVSAALDDLANAHLVRGDGDAAVEYLYRAINHGTPLITWCEERGQEPGTNTCTGDRQHLWTPLAIVRVLRNSLLMEKGDILHLAQGIDREWLTSGQPVGVVAMNTHFGQVSYRLQFDKTQSIIQGTCSLTGTGSKRPAQTYLHVRLPAQYGIVQAVVNGTPVPCRDETIQLGLTKGPITFQIELEALK
ncbi:hypothetical protein [Paenibacillus sp. GCM10027626]|uniref:hypothetical protein n=1 Tax=Paenibacillus sp. GCM10027626 TaxID=3273411 RepID=UPI0036422FA2